MELGVAFSSVIVNSVLKREERHRGRSGRGGVFVTISVVWVHFIVHLQSRVENYILQVVNNINMVEIFYI